MRAPATIETAAVAGEELVEVGLELLPLHAVKPSTASAKKPERSDMISCLLPVDVAKTLPFRPVTKRLRGRSLDEFRRVSRIRSDFSVRKLREPLLDAADRQHCVQPAEGERVGDGRAHAHLTRGIRD